MSHDRKFRFAAQLRLAGSAKEWADNARKVEDLGYSTLTMPDHFDEQLAPVPALMAAADATSSLRIGTLVFDNDYKHPLVLAKECATLDLMSDGRLEIGFGAGWMRTDYEQSGIAYDPPKVRVDRFEEALRVLKGLFGDGPFSHAGEHYTITEHDGSPKPLQRRSSSAAAAGGSCRSRHAKQTSSASTPTSGPARAVQRPRPTSRPRRRPASWSGSGRRPATASTTSSSTR